MDTSRQIDDLFSAKDLIIVLTGGGSGIGLAFATALARAGAAKVYLLGRRLEVLEKAASSIDPKVIVPVRCDVTDPESIAAAVKRVEQDQNYIDVVINNAGINGPDHARFKEAKTIEEVQKEMLKDWSGWETTFATNTSSIVAVSGACLHLLDEGNKRRGWVHGKREIQKRISGDSTDPRTSQIITVSSISAHNRVFTAGIAYTASKAGATMLGKALAHNLAPFGIRSNVIAPGRFPSEMTAGSATLFPVDQIPHGTPGEYGDLAGVILYLVGKAGAYVNGNVQVVDGGRLAVMPATY